MTVRRRVMAVGLLVAAVACNGDDEAATTTGSSVTEPPTTLAAAPTTSAVPSTSAGTVPATPPPTSAAVTEATVAPVSGELSVVVADYSAATRLYWEERVDDVEARHPALSINLDVVSWEQINERIDVRVQAGDPPDVVNIDAFAAYAADDLLRPVAAVVAPERLADVLPNFAANASIDGVQVAMPFTATVRALLYNRDLFSAASVGAPPATWDELRAAARAVTDLPGDEVGYAMPLGPEEAQAEASIWMFGNGGGWVDETGAYAIDSPANIDAFTYMGGLAAAGVTQPEPAATDRTDALGRFFAGEVAMVEGLPQVAEFAAEQPGLSIGVAPPPTRTGESATLGSADHIVVFANDGNEDAARAFLDVVFATDNHVAFLDAEGFLPVTASGVEAMRATVAPDRAAFLDVLPAARFYPANERSWNTVQSAVQVQIGQAVTGDPAAVLGQLQALAEAS